MGFFVSHKERGFTLAEIVVVAGIIALLSSVVMVNVSESRRESRDTQRVSDLGQIQLALRMYKDVEGSYPAYPEGDLIGDGSNVDTAFASYVTGTIRDPLNTGSNRYYYDSSYNCNGSPSRVLIALTMERPNRGNHTSVCGATPPESLGTIGITPTSDSYILILR